MATEPDLAARIAALENRAAIADLVHRYALFVRSDMAAECAGLFTADAVFETREASGSDPATFSLRDRRIGQEAIVDQLRHGGAQGIRLYPSITNLLIDLHGTTATATSLMTATMRPGGRQVSGHYHDSFVQDGQWRFSARVYTILA